MLFFFPSWLQVQDHFAHISYLRCAKDAPSVLLPSKTLTLTSVQTNYIVYIYTDTLYVMYIYIYISIHP